MAAEVSGKKIVIIDDEKSFVDIFTFVLKKEGFETRGYSDPQEALKNILEDKPDAILLDLAMPKINGFDVIKHLQQIKDNFGSRFPKIIIITNLRYTEGGVKIDDEFAKSVGAIGVIYKTDDMEQTIKRIKNYLS